MGHRPATINKLPLFFKMVKRHRTGDRSAFGRAKRQGGVPERSAGPSDPQAKSVPGRKNSSIDEPSLAWRDKPFLRLHTLLVSGLPNLDAVCAEDSFEKLHGTFRGYGPELPGILWDERRSSSEAKQSAP